MRYYKISGERRADGKERWFAFHWERGFLGIRYWKTLSEPWFDDVPISSTRAGAEAECHKHAAKLDKAEQGARDGAIVANLGWSKVLIREGEAKPPPEEPKA